MSDARYLFRVLSTEEVHEPSAITDAYRRQTSSSARYQGCYEVVPLAIMRLAYKDEIVSNGWSTKVPWQNQNHIWVQT